MTYGVRILKENCTPADADDVKLPYTAYLVTYKKDGETKYDLTMCQKAVDLFDHYYDCLLYTSPSPRDRTRSRMPSSA